MAAVPTEQRPTSRQRRLASHGGALPPLSRQPSVILGQIASFLPLSDTNALFTASWATAAASRDDANVWRALVMRDFPHHGNGDLGAGGSWKHSYLVKRAARRLTEQTLWVWAVNKTQRVTFVFMVGGVPVPNVEMKGRAHEMRLHVTNPYQTFPQTAALQRGIFDSGPYVRNLDERDLDPEWWGAQFVWSLMATFYEEMILQYVPGQDPQALTVIAVAELQEFKEVQSTSAATILSFGENLKYTKAHGTAYVPAAAQQWRPRTDLVLTARDGSDELQVRWQVYKKRNSASVGVSLCETDAAEMSELLPFTIATNNSDVLAHIHEGLNEPELLHLFYAGRHPNHITASYTIVYYIAPLVRM